MKVNLYMLKRKYYATYPVKQNSGKYFPEKEKRAESRGR